MTRNLTANLVGRVWAAGIQFAFVPVYLRYVGIEGYGLIGFFTTLLALSNVLDLGLSSTLNRELARTPSEQLASSETRNRLRTFEVTYLALALLVGGAIMMGAPWVADRWLQQQRIDPTELERATLLMGLVLAAQWPVSLYSGAHLGLRREVRLNVVNVVLVTTRTVGAAIVLAFVSPSMVAFFAWQLIASTLHSLCLRSSVWRLLPCGPRPRFRPACLVQVWRFAAGVSGISILGILFTQMDKVVLSGLLDLTTFGYYSLAAVVASGISYLVLPIFEVAYPRFTSLAFAADTGTLSRTYHTVSQVMAVIVAPTVVTAAAFASPLVLAWTGSPSTAERAATLIVLLVVGTGLNGLSSVPYALMLAHGWTRLPLGLNLSFAALFVPILLLAVARFGAAGGAGTWLLLNLGYVTIMVMLMHRRLLAGHAHRWYAHDVGPAVLSTTLVALLFRSALSFPTSRIGSAALLAAIGLILATVGAFSTGATRDWILRFLRRRSGGSDFSAN